MRCQQPLAQALLGALFLVLPPMSISAQSPNRLQNCSGHPISPYALTPTRDDKPHPNVSIEDVTSEGATNLPEGIKAQIVERVKQANYYPDSDGKRALEDIVRNVLQEQGYFYTQQTIETHIIGTESQVKRVLVNIDIDQGGQYRLKEIGFKNATVFPEEQLRSQFALQDGDIFDLGKIRKGFEALSRLYGRVGYLNFTATPDIYTDSAQRLILVILELDAAEQFRVGSIEILGLDPKIVNTVLKMKLRRGDIFDSKLARDFFIDNKSALPVDASEVDDLWIKQDPVKATVTIVFDFRPCPRSSQ